MNSNCHGSEAKLYRFFFLSKDSILKVRLPKKYRNEQIDLFLRKIRTKNEAKILKEIRKNEIRTPIIYSIDLKKCSLLLEFINSPTLKTILNNNKSYDLKKIFKDLGTLIAKLHNAKISHGDLTPNNILFSFENNFCLIDPSLGSTNSTIENLAIDLFVFKKTLFSIDTEKNLFETFYSSYKQNTVNFSSIHAILDKIEKRRRYL